MTIIEPEETPVSVGVLLFIPYRHMEQRVLAAVVAGGYDISLAQAQVSKQAAGFLVDELERGGYVERIADPTDRRARLIRITSRGRGAVAVALVEQRRVEAEWEGRLGAARMADLRRALEELRELTDL